MGAAFHSEDSALTAGFDVLLAAGHGSDCATATADGLGAIIHGLNSAITA
ncbi:hypothetical protein [Anaerovibrio sp.]|nr:hypothetical protein [Anaerovibrio sp.]